jgi:hypothetical protein
VSNFRVSTHAVGVVAAVAALVLGLFAGGASAWYGGGETGGNEETTPVGPTSPTGPTGPSEGNANQPTVPPGGEATPPGPQPLSTGMLPAAPQPVPAVPAAPTPAIVKGVIGTREKGKTSETPTVLAAAGGNEQTAAGGGLARTGLDLLPAALLGVLALGASSFLFWRARRC